MCALPFKFHKDSKINESITITETQLDTFLLVTTVCLASKIHYCNDTLH